MHDYERIHKYDHIIYEPMLPVDRSFLHQRMPNGAIFTSSSGTTYKANYFGGTGNDLTLKVVP